MAGSAHRGKTSPSKASFCFVTETARVDRPVLDPSVRYRCFHPAEALAAKGHLCSVYSAPQFAARPSVDFDVYVFHRPSVARPAFRKVFERLSKLGRVLVADYDDLIFGSRETAACSSAVRNKGMTLDQATIAFDRNLEALNMFSRVTVSTAPLAARVRQANPSAKVQVIPNHITESMRGFHRRLGTATQKRSRRQIGYFAGTKSHDRDLPIAEEVLHRVLSENQDFSLLVVGPVRLPGSLASLPNVVCCEAVPYWRLPWLMALCHTVIAPLETSAFNDCKSRVKFLEAALAGCRLVATPIPDVRAIGERHITLCSTNEDWYRALSNPDQGLAHQALVDANLDFIWSPIDTVTNVWGLA